MAQHNNPYIQKAVSRLVEIPADERARMIYEARVKNELDAAAYADDARAEGMANKAAEIAGKMLQRGRPIEEISEMTGLTAQEIQLLRA